MNNDKIIDLCIYRIRNAKDTLETAKLCLDNGKYKDAVNRCYYAAFYAIKAVLALEEVDFKRHKDVIAYFNKNYIATNIFDREIGKRLGQLQRKRENGDYDDFYIVSSEEAKEQYITANTLIETIQKYLEKKNITK